MRYSGQRHRAILAAARVTPLPAPTSPPVSSMMLVAFFANLSLHLLFPAPGASQGLPPLDEYHVRVFQPADGLPISEIRSVMQDGRGLLHLATARGLFSFNGYEFRPVPLPDVESRVLETLHRDRHGRLWIVFRNGNVGLLRDGRVHLVTTDGEPLMQLRELSDGSLWAFHGRMFARVQATPPFFTRFDLGEAVDGGIDELHEAPDGTALLRVDSDLFRLEGTLGPGVPKLTGPILSIKVGPVVRGDSTGVWFLRSDRLIRYHDGETTTYGPGTPEYDRFQLERYWFAGLLQGADGNEWMRFQDANSLQILLRWTGTERRRVHLRRHLQFRDVVDFYEDHEGSVWVSTDRGLIQLVPRPVQELNNRHGLAEEFTVPVRQMRDGSVWVGTWGQGIHVFGDEGLVQRIATEEGLPNNHVRALYETADGDVWAGLLLAWVRLRGLQIAESGGRESTRGPDQYRAFAVGPDGQTWMGSMSHLWRREDDAFHPFRPDVFGDRSIWALHASGEDLWVGTENGLFRVSPDTVVSYGPEDGLESPFVASISEDATGTLWFGTYAHGLHRYRDGRFTALTRQDGMHHDGIWCMLADDSGGVWMSSDGGLARLELAKMHQSADAIESGAAQVPRLHPLVFTESEGMPTRESNRGSPSCWKLDDGRMVFNSVAGVAVVDPAKAIARPVPPNSEVTRVLADGRPLNRSDRSLPPDTDHLTFEFAAYSYLAPAQNRYRYRLDGYDDDWIDSGTRNFTTYTNLDPGEYSFQVQAASGPGAWGEPSPAISFTIAPPPWQTLPFRLAAAAVLVGLLALAYRSRVQHLLEMQRLRLQIAADLHDDVGSNLSSIALLSQMLGGRETLDGLERRQLRRIRAAAEETVDALRHIIWLVDPKHDDLAALLRKMRTVAANLLDGRSYEFQTPDPIAPVSLDMQWMHNVFLIYKEALHNVAKHAPESRVQIEIRTDDDTLHLSVRDDGPGIDPAANGTGRGLTNMRRRAEQIGGELHHRSGPDGTTVTLEAPLA